MKLTQRIAAGSLSVLLAAGMSLPALAADESLLEKDETVYVVLENDGSVRSQTVSAHLHKEGGLAGVTDRSGLTDIENTQDSSTFTRNGENLVWDTDNEDLYYKGESSKTAPVTAEIIYSLDGKQAPLEELLGQSGRLKITVALTNNETGEITIDGKKHAVATPFITMVGAILDEGWENVEAPHGMVKSIGTKQAAGFVCLPGVRECIEGLLPEDMEDIEDYLQDQVVLEADVTDLKAPSLFLVCGTDAESLKEDGLTGMDGLDSLDSLQEDMDALNDGMSELLDGADRLADGARQLNSGALELLAGVDTLVQGANQIYEGAVALRDGAQELSSGADSARNGALQLQSGAYELAGGLNSLQNGAGALSSGYSQLKSGSESLNAGLSELTAKNNLINAGIKQLRDSAAALSAAMGPEGQVTLGAQQFGSALSGAAAGGAAAMEQLPTPEAYAQLLAAAGVSGEAQSQLLAAYTGAYQSAGSMSVGLAELDRNFVQLAAGIQQVGAGAQALLSAVDGENGLAAGLSAYTQGVAAAGSGAAQLDAGLAELGQNIPALTGGVSQLVEGSNRLAAGAGELAGGNAALADGAQRLYQGSEALVQGTAQLPAGGVQLLDGVKALQQGAQALADGAGDLKDGLNRYNDEGISKLTGALDTEELGRLKAIVKEMENRREQYGSFSGAPEDAEVTTRFIMKTAETVEAPENDDTKIESTEAEHKDLWQRIKDLFGGNND